MLEMGLRPWALELLAASRDHAGAASGRRR